MDYILNLQALFVCEKLHWRIPGGARDAYPLVNSFSAKLLSNNRVLIHTQGLAPGKSRLGNPGSATELHWQKSNYCSLK